MTAKEKRFFIEVQWEILRRAHVAPDCEYPVVNSDFIIVGFTASQTYNGELPYKSFNKNGRLKKSADAYSFCLLSDMPKNSWDEIDYNNPVY